MDEINSLLTLDIYLDLLENGARNAGLAKFSKFFHVALDQSISSIVYAFDQMHGIDLS